MHETDWRHFVVALRPEEEKNKKSKRELLLVIGARTFSQKFFDSHEWSLMCNLKFKYCNNTHKSRKLCARSRSVITWVKFNAGRRQRNCHNSGNRARTTTEPEVGLILAPLSHSMAPTATCVIDENCGAQIIFALFRSRLYLARAIFMTFFPHELGWNIALARGWGNKVFYPNSLFFTYSSTNNGVD